MSVAVVSDTLAQRTEFALMPSALPAGALVIDEDDDDDSPPPLSPADVDPRAADDDAALAASLGSALRSAPPQHPHTEHSCSL